MSGRAGAEQTAVMLAATVPTPVRRSPPLARSLAGHPVGREDLEQAASLGLVTALQRFDPERECALSPLAA